MAESETRTENFQNISTKDIQDVHEEYEVEILDLGLLSATQCRVTLSGDPAQMEALIEYATRPREIPEIVPPENIDP